MHVAVVASLVWLGAQTAAAQPAEPEHDPEIQADLGLGVIGATYEHPLDETASLAVGAQLFSTYYAPWFGAGDAVLGGGLEARYTQFLGADFYVTPFFRGARVGGSRDGASGAAFGFSTGVFVGRTFAIGSRIDLRVGLGPEYILFEVPTDQGLVKVSTPFIGLDLILGYRL